MHTSYARFTLCTMHTMHNRLALRWLLAASRAACGSNKSYGSWEVVGSCVLCYDMTHGIAAAAAAGAKHH